MSVNMNKTPTCEKTIVCTNWNLYIYPFEKLNYTVEPRYKEVGYNKTLL